MRYLGGTASDTYPRKPPQRSSAVHLQRQGRIVDAACPPPAGDPNLPADRRRRAVERDRVIWISFSSLGFVEKKPINQITAAEETRDQELGEIARRD
jgi:hypothetical protein